MMKMNLCMQRWGYPREYLVYLREIGEGQFGKVHLMNAKVRMYVDKIPNSWCKCNLVAYVYTYLISLRKATFVLHMLTLDDNYTTS